MGLIEELKSITDNEAKNGYIYYMSRLELLGDDPSELIEVLSKEYEPLINVADAIHHAALNIHNYPEDQANAIAFGAALMLGIIKEIAERRVLPPDMVPKQ